MNMELSMQDVKDLLRAINHGRAEICALPECPDELALDGRLEAMEDRLRTLAGLPDDWDDHWSDYARANG